MLALWAAVPARGANEPVTIENVRLGFQDKFKLGTWTPIAVDLKAGLGRFQGIVEVEVADDDGTPTIFRREVDLSPSAFDTIALFARPGSQHGEMTVSVWDQSHRRRIASKRLDLFAGALDPQQTALLALGNPRGVTEVPLPIADPSPTSTNVQEQPIVVLAPGALPHGIPGRWYGYDGIDAVVLDTNDDLTMQALNTRGEALRQWVQHGGHLVVAIGGKWQAANDSFLKEMLPARGAGRIKIGDTGALESFAGPNSKPLVPAGGPGMEVTKLELVEARSPHALDNTAATPVVVRGAYGFGRVTVVGLDVDQRPFLDWASKRDFWIRALDLRLNADEMTAGAGPMSGMARGRFFQSNASDISTTLHQSLEQFPGVKLVPFGWVAFFVFLYILLIGPGDYFFLKKVLKRMELTWITFPLIVVGVSVLAYVAAYRIKGTDLRVNKLDIVDVDATSGQLRGSTFFTVFSPQNRDYHVAIAPASIGERPIPSAKSAETMVSWFGSPEAYFGGMGNATRMSLSTSPYLYGPIGEPRQLDDVRIPIWTTKGFAGRWFGRAPQVVESKLERSGADRIEGSVTNLLDEPLTGARLVFGKQIYDLGEIKPGETKTLDVRNEILGGYLSRLSLAIPGSNRSNGPQAESDTAVSHRPEIARLLMFYDSTSRTNQANLGPLANGPLHTIDLTGLLALDRPMLVAEIGGDAATLDLGTTSSPPKVDRTTVLRVILPLK
jgi:hypothetical protein